MLLLLLLLLLGWVHLSSGTDQLKALEYFVRDGAVLDQEAVVRLLLLGCLGLHHLKYLYLLL